MKKILALLPLLLAAPAHAAPDPYEFDKDHTHILFYVSHVGFSDTIGRMDAFDGSFSFDEKEPEKSTLDVTVKAGSIDTGVRELDKMLKGPKFLNADAFPDIHFKSVRVEPVFVKKCAIPCHQTGNIYGNLTLLGITRPALLHVTYNRSGVHPFTNNYVSGFSGDFIIKRSDFGMNAYIPDVGDEVRVHVEAEGTDALKHPGNSKAPH